MTAAARTFGWREALGILVCAWAGWAGFAAVGFAGVGDFIRWCWYLPLPYFLAWFAVMLPRLPAVVGAILLLGFANAVLACNGFVFGVLTLGVLALPMMVICAAILGVLVGQVHVYYDPDIAARWWWRWTHVCGCTVAYAALAIGLFVWFRSPNSFSPWAVTALFCGAPTAGFAWHLVATVRLARGSRPALQPGGRWLAALSLNGMLGAIMFWALR